MYLSCLWIINAATTLQNGQQILANTVTSAVVQRTLSNTQVCCKHSFLLRQFPYKIIASCNDQHQGLLMLCLTWQICTLAVWQDVVWRPVSPWTPMRNNRLEQSSRESSSRLQYTNHCQLTTIFAQISHLQCRHIITNQVNDTSVVREKCLPLFCRSTPADQVRMGQMIPYLFANKCVCHLGLTVRNN